MAYTNLQKLFISEWGTPVNFQGIILNENGFASDSDSAVSTQLATKTYIDDNGFSVIVDSLDTDVVDMSKKVSYLYRTLTENVTLTITGAKKGNKCVLFLDGDHFVQYDPAIDSEWYGGYDGTDAKVNRVEIRCTNDAAGQEEFDMEIFTRNPNTDIHSVWELSEKGGDFVCGIGNAKTADVVSESFPSDMTWEPHVGSPSIGGKYKIRNTITTTTSCDLASISDNVVFPTEWSFGCWIKAPSSVNDNRFLEISNSGTERVVMQIQTGILHITTRSNGLIKDYYLTGSPGFSLGVWNHFVYTQSTSGVARFFINNSEKFPAVSGTGGNGILSTVLPMGITILSAPGGTFSWGGDMAQIELTEGVLSPAQITSLFNAGEGATIESVIGTPAYDALDFAYRWDLNEGPQNRVIGVDNAGNEVGSEELPSVINYEAHTGNPTIAGDYKLSRNSATAVPAPVLLQNLTLPSSFTMNVWIQPDVLNSGLCFFDLSEQGQGSGGDIISLCQNNSGQPGPNLIWLHVKNGTLYDVNILNSAGYSAGDIVMVSGVVDASGNLSLYKDGSQLGSTIPSSTVNTANVWELALYGRANLTTAMWPGNILHAEIMEGTLNGTQLLSIYNTGIGTTIETEIGTPAWEAKSFAYKWDMNQPPVTASKTLPHVASLDSNILPSGVTRIPASSVSAPAICGPVVYDFDGTSNGHLALNTETFGGVTGYSVWVRNENIATPNAFAYYGNPDAAGNANMIRVSLHSTGYAFFQFHDGGAFRSLLGTSETYAQDAWVHVYCQITPANVMEIYINGVKDAATLSVPSTIPTVARTHYLGSRDPNDTPNETGDFLDGQIGRFGWIDGNLTEKQIELLYNEGRGNSLANVLS